LTVANDSRLKLPSDRATVAAVIGQKLGHYEITDRLGAGGMGEVFRALDRRLGRSVAIKALPEAFAQDAGRLERFDREARALAALNHPHIAAIYGIEEHERRRFLVLELVEGETLAERVTRGPIAVGEAVRLALQIAEALEAAHDKGIVHRDLKPANIKITPEGNIKVLDFGLAKALGEEPVQANLSNSPTLSMQATGAGIILGTAAYMAPEQARGLSVDERADIWAFGCVLYEMLTGRQAFKGELVSDVLASVLARDPDYSILKPELHPRIQDLLRRCLEKDPRQRWQAVGDVRIDLEHLVANPSATGQSIALAGERKVLTAGSDAHYVPTGHLTYAVGDTLFGVPFDAGAVRLSGGPVPVVSGVRRPNNPGINTGTAQYGVSRNGLLAYIAETGVGAQSSGSLVWVDRRGRAEPVENLPQGRLYEGPRL
jgi:serine/threonine protein kinase